MCVVQIDLYLDAGKLVAIVQSTNGLYEHRRASPIRQNVFVCVERPLVMETSLHFWKVQEFIAMSFT